MRRLRTGSTGRPPRSAQSYELRVAWAVVKHYSDCAEAAADYFGYRDQSDDENLVHQRAITWVGCSRRRLVVFANVGISPVE